jgi:hypothetical protein
MFPHRPRSRRQRRLVAGVNAWVLLVFVLGIVLSSVGQMKSHGLSALGAAEHCADCRSDDGHAHAHDDDGVAALSEAAGHPHHSGDHSHDRAHTWPPDLAVGMSDPSRWRWLIDIWIALLSAYRLERPPMA